MKTTGSSRTYYSYRRIRGQDSVVPKEEALPLGGSYLVCSAPRSERSNMALGYDVCAIT